jgi:hypothetical protein
MNPPALALTLLMACIEHQKSSKHEHCWGYTGGRVGESKVPAPPTFQPCRRKEFDQPHWPGAPQRPNDGKAKAASFTPAMRASG